MFQFEYLPKIKINLIQIILLNPNSKKCCLPRKISNPPTNFKTIHHGINKPCRAYNSHSAAPKGLCQAVMVPLTLNRLPLGLWLQWQCNEPDKLTQSNNITSVLCNSGQNVRGTLRNQPGQRRFCSTFVVFCP